MTASSSEPATRSRSGAVLLPGTEPKGRHLGVPARRRPFTALLLAVALVPSASADERSERARLIAERLPRIVHRGGPFLRRPEITTVTFAGEDRKLVARLEEFGGRIVRSAWWREVAEGYCLGEIGRASCRERV